MSKQEKIVCAAVEVYVIPIENWYASPFTHIFKVVNHKDYKEEEIYSYLEILDEPVFGFITNKNRFVDAEEALKITGWGNQLRFKDRKYLLPEDLY